MQKDWSIKKILNSEILLCKSSIGALKEDLKTVDKKIKELIDNDPQLKELFDIVDSVVNTKASRRSVIKLIKKSKRCSIMEPCPPSNTAKNLKNIGRRTAINVKLMKVKMKCSLSTTFVISESTVFLPVLLEEKNIMKIIFNHLHES